MMDKNRFRSGEEATAARYRRAETKVRRHLKHLHFLSFCVFSCMVFHSGRCYILNKTIKMKDIQAGQIY